MYIFDFVIKHMEGGTLHLPSIFDYEDNFEGLAGLIGAARKKGVTVVFDNENEIFGASGEGPSSLESVRLASWSAYFVMNKLHVKHYMDYLAVKNQSI